MELTDRIFYKAIEEFRDYGIKFTMDGLAARLGISKRTLYETVPSKEKVIELVIDRTFENVKDQQREVLENESLELSEKIKRLMTIVPVYSDLIDYRQAAEIGKSYPVLHKKIQDGIEKDWGATLQLLEQGIAEGVVKPYSMAIVKELIYLAYERLLDGRFLIKNGITYDKALEEVTAIILSGILEK